MVVYCAILLQIPSESAWVAEQLLPSRTLRRHRFVQIKAILPRHSYSRDAKFTADECTRANLPLSDLVLSTDEYKETSRLYRRTVFTEQDWIRFRSSGRLFDNLATMFTSGVIRGLWFEIGSVTCVSTLVYLINAAILSGALEPAVPAADTSLLALPSLPFQLSSPALGLLLVFRTNTVYSRWNQVRRFTAICQNIQIIQPE